MPFRLARASLLVASLASVPLAQESGSPQKRRTPAIAEAPTGEPGAGEEATTEEMRLSLHDVCASSIRNQANPGQCLRASTVPTFGLLFPYPGQNNDFSGTNVVSGGVANSAGATHSTIGGGGSNATGDVGATVGGGVRNVAGGQWATVAGGSDNFASGRHAAIGGGDGHDVLGWLGTVGGGWSNDANGPYATVGGGAFNRALGASSTVAGGFGNRASGYAATVGGGGSYFYVDGYYANTASGTRSTVAGGGNNKATALYTSIGGGYKNTAASFGATVPGGRYNKAYGAYTFAAGRSSRADGAYSFAMGRFANASHDGAFVWGDSQLGIKPSSAADEFSVYASGGARIFTNSAATTGVAVAPGGGSWSSVSDRAAKENFAVVDVRAVLEKVAALPISTWNYRAQDRSVRHMGPTAQDFRAAFGLGASERLIDTIDPDGVALAAIQGLNQRDGELERRLAEKEAEVDELRGQVARLEARLTDALAALASDG